MDLGERRAGLLCESATGKDSWENPREKWDRQEGTCTQPSANRVHWKSFDATKYDHGDAPGTAALPEQVLICIPKDISCQYLFVNMSCFHCYHRNATDFRLISHQNLLVLDVELLQGCLCWMPKGSFVLCYSDLCCSQKHGVTWRVCRTHTYGCVHICVYVLVFGHIDIHRYCCKIGWVHIQWCGNKTNHWFWVQIILSCQVEPK